MHFDVYRIVPPNNNVFSELEWSEQYVKDVEINHSIDVYW